MPTRNYSVFLWCRVGPKSKADSGISKSRRFSPTTPSHTNTHRDCRRLTGDRWTRWKHSHPVSNRDISNSASHHRMQTGGGTEADSSHNTAVAGALSGISALNEFPREPRRSSCWREFHRVASLRFFSVHSFEKLKWFEFVWITAESNLNLVLLERGRLFVTLGN